MMNTMHALQMFDNGEYMVITVDMETYSYREAYKYLWRKYPHHLDICSTVSTNSQIQALHVSTLTAGTKFKFQCENLVFILTLVICTLAAVMFVC